MKNFSEKNSDTPTNLSIIFLFALALTLVVFGAYVLHFIINEKLIENIIEQRNIWAQFGNYAGGALSPILAFLALIALLYSIHIQTKELNHSVEQLSKSAEALDNQNNLIRKQNFEATFFQMLKLYNEIVQTITATHGSGPTKKEGRDALAYIYTSFKNNYFDDEKICQLDPEKDKIKKYEEFYENNGQKIGHYYRIIYNILKFVGN